MSAPTATWTTPKTWADAETLTEPDFNQYLSSNLMFLKTPTQNRLANQATTNTTSTSFVDITGATLTITTNAAACIVWFTGSFNISTAATAVITLLVDGVNQGDTTQGLQYVPATAATNAGIAFPFKTAVLTANSHTFKLQYKTSTGTLTLLAGWHMFVQEA